MDISRIPADVIMAIFECIALSLWLSPKEEEMMELEHALPPFPWNDISTIIAGSHVCKRWREAVLTTRACWSTIVVNLDICTKEDVIRSQIHKMGMHFIRARNRPMTLILINDSPRTAPNMFPPHFIHALHRCLLGVSGLHARVIRGDIAFSILTMLSEVRKLEHLAFWHTRCDEIRDITNIREDCNRMKGHLPDTYLRHAPLLRTVYTRGLPYPNPNREPSLLPGIERLVVDDYLSDVGVSPDTTILQTFANATSLTLLSDGGTAPTTTSGPVVFLALEHLEMNTDVAHAFFVLSKRIVAPHIRDLGIHLNNMKWEDGSDVMPDIATFLQSSDAPFKSLTIHKFAHQLARASHSRCLQVISAFWFIDCLEYRQCVLRFPSTWDNVWRPGNDDAWDDLVAMETYSGISPIGEYDDDSETDEELPPMGQGIGPVVPSGAGSDTGESRLSPFDTKHKADPLVS
jgi:hypothetical protein